MGLHSNVITKECGGIGIESGLDKNTEKMFLKLPVLRAMSCLGVGCCSVRCAAFGSARATVALCAEGVAPWRRAAEVRDSGTP
ncbi:hypothetical protein EVAR_35770_1 [Eumeta japonica]|uniref:Uncharacterized protein n=1 Tax=Eumeta variegata TaxID=151549 RepID=A0A4C1WMS0_EUMVA|nr:hypothetical protein EVAR_35770_1 [Eumeta japonica]